MVFYVLPTCVDMTLKVPNSHSSEQIADSFNFNIQLFQMIHTIAVYELEYQTLWKHRKVAAKIQQSRNVYQSLNYNILLH